VSQLIDLKKDFDLGNKFLLDVASELSNTLDDSYRVVIKYDLQDYNIPKDDKKNILFALSRETHELPRYTEDERIFLTFHNYAPLDAWGHPINHPKVVPLPLGFFINDMTSKVEEIKPHEDREYDFCFVGQIPHTGTRDKFKRCLDNMLERIGNKYKYYVKYTESFGCGLDHQEYIDLLNNSKICLCPTGAYSDESFRFFESIAMGAFPMVEMLPRFWYYEQAPMFFAKWQFLDSFLENSLNFLRSENKRVALEQIVNYNNTILNTVTLSGFLKKIIDEQQIHTNKLQDPLQSP
jgi:hypothetical protein